MRILSSRCRTFAYTITTPSRVAMELGPAVIGTVNRFDGCLFLMVGVERDDIRLGSRPVKTIRRIAAKTDAQCVVINGFSHLAHPGIRPDVDTARGVLDRLVEGLQARSLRVHLMPFGWNKQWTADVLDGEWEQRMDHLTPSVPHSHAVRATTLPSPPRDRTPI